MKSLLLNSEGNIEFDNLNNLKMIEGIKEITQRNIIGMKINQGEWVFEKTLGIPWIKIMSDKFMNEDDFKKYIEDELKSDDDIQEIIEINVDKNEVNRNMKIKFKAKLVNDKEIEQEIEV